MSREVRKGEPWGRPAAGPPDAEVDGGDAALAACASRHPGARVAFSPDASSDLARALGLRGAELELPVDGLRFEGMPAPHRRRGFPDTEPPAAGGAATEASVTERWDGELALNAIVLGTPPDRLRWWNRAQRVTVTIDGRERFGGPAVAVVIANGQYLRGRDISPRGHPGDGRIEVQVYDVAPRERAEMRRRLPRGDHVPHPRIHELAGRRVGVAVAGRGMALEADGVARGRTSRLPVEVASAALWVRL